MAGRTLIAATEPVQAVLVHPVEQTGDPEARRQRLMTKAALLAIFWEWTPGPSLAERRHQAYALLGRLSDPDEHQRQRRRLAHLLAIAEAVGGPSPEAIRAASASEAADGTDPLVSIFFRPTPGPASLVARRREARALLAALGSGRAYDQALRLYHAIGVLTDPGRGDDDAA